MPKFRSRPVVIEAEQYDEFSSAPMDGVCGYGSICAESGDYCKVLHVHVWNGSIRISHGDWVTRDGHGDFELISAGMMAAAYEPVDEDAPRQPGPAPKRFADLAAPVRAAPGAQERIEAYKQELDDRQSGPAGVECG